MVDRLESKICLAAELIADINQTPVPNFLSGVTLVGSHGFFTAGGPAGTELYRTNATFTAASLVRDLRPGNSGSEPKDLTAVGNELYFTADDGQNGRELYRSDGTEAGTVRVTDLIPAGQTNSEVSWLAGLSNRLFFVAEVVPDSFGSATLYCYTPSTGQLVPLFDTYSHFEGIGILRPVAAGSTVYFPALSENGIWKLWKTDGTAVGTVPMHDLIAGTFPQTAPVLAAFNDRLLFSGSTWQKGTELYITDGTPGGTRMLRDIALGTASSSPENFRIIGAEAYFSADDGIYGREVWKTDGTPGGTTLVADVEPGPGSSTPYQFARSGSRVSFVATGGASGDAIWATDGTDTEMLLNLEDGILGSRPDEIVTFTDFALFSHQDAPNGRELWRTDGTVAGTWRVVDLNPGIGHGAASFSSATVSPLGVLYTGNDGVHGSELWRSDGTAAGTVMVQDLRFGTASSGIYFGGYPLSAGGRLYFEADDGVSGYEPWSTDGTEAGTLRLADVMTGLESSYASDFIDARDRVYFVARDPVHGPELWRTDGTPAGTSLLKDIRPGTEWGVSDPMAATSSGNLYFFANDGVHGMDLWFTDGTEAGTRLVLDTPLTTGLIQQWHMITLGEIALFTRPDETGRMRLWRSDGTEAGTHMLGTVSPNFTQLITDSRMVVMNDAVYFPGYLASGLELWRTDGTEEGTYAVSTLPGSIATVWKGSIYLADYYGKLWRTDGTPGGLVLLKDFGRNGLYSLSNFAPAGDRLVFRAPGPSHLDELWSTDGTPAGTFAVRTEFPDIGSSLIEELTSAGDLAFFRLNNILWVTDGTPGGASRVDLGVPDASFTMMGEQDGVLFLYLGTPEYGGEPWRFDYAGRDLLAPGVSASNFDVDRREVTFTFSETVTTTGALSGVTMLNKRTGVSVDVPPLVIRLLPGGRELAVDLSSMNLGDADYAVRIPGGIVADAAGNRSQDPHEHSFFHMRADLNRDRMVNFADLEILAQNYGQTGRTFSQGNIDYSADGLVGFDDLLMLAQRYRTSLSFGNQTKLTINQQFRVRRDDDDGYHWL